MDDLARNALSRGIGAFLAVLLAGTALVFLLDHVGDGSATSTDSPTPTRSSTGEPKPPPTTPDATLAWLPGGFPPGFVDDLGSLADIDQLSVAAAGIAWMTRSMDENGKVVDSPHAPYEIPLDVTAIDVGTFGPLLPKRAARVLLELQPGQGVLSKSSAAFRRVGVGATLQFTDPDGSTKVKIVAVLPDVWVGGYELVVPRATGEDLGVKTDRYAMFTLRRGVDPDADRLSAQLAAFVPDDAISSDVQVRLSGETRLLRPDDLALAPMRVKERFGEFTARPEPFSPDNLQIDPAWIERHIATQTLPVFGTITCNKAMFPLLRPIAGKLETESADTAVTEVEGCFDEAGALADPLAPISMHAWGVAIDVDADLDPAVEGGDQDPRVVAAMEQGGFIWGSRFPEPEPVPHHYEYHHKPGASDLPPAPTVAPSASATASPSA
jgi:D-alanyl-D-alanine carboxypeptidase